MGLAPITTAVAFFAIVAFLQCCVTVRAQDNNDDDDRHHRHSDIDNLYCGMENCYQILSLEQNANREEISRAYRKLARQFHPDVYKGDLSIKEATEMFRKIANAYEILSDEESRADYDYLLDNPEAYYEHYYRYYRHRVAPHVDWRIVIGGLIFVISVIQYVLTYLSYQTLVTRVATTPRFRFQALQIGKEKGLLQAELEADRQAASEERIRDQSELRRRQREAEERVILRVITETPSEVDQGLTTLLLPAKLQNTLFYQLCVFPMWLWRTAVVYTRYYALSYGVGCRSFLELTDNDKHDLIRRRLGLSGLVWAEMNQDAKDEYLSLELWRAESFSEWQADREAEVKRKLAQSGRYKQAKRWEKSHAGERMSFEPD